MKAIVLVDQQEPIQLVELPEPVPGKGECLVRIKTAALNRRDQWIREGMYPDIQYGTVLGSDGCGIVIEGSEKWIGREVIINPNVDWGSDPQVQSENYSVLGMPENGTLAEYIVVPEDRIHPRPARLNCAEAAALPLAGLTAFRATIKKGLVGKEKKILVTGAGGGVSQFAVSFSVVSGADTYVTSGSDDKIANCITSGAKGGFNYKDERWVKNALKVGAFDAIIDSVGGNQLNNYLKIIKPSGRIVMYGSTTGYPEKVDVFKLFWSQAQIIGSTMGSDDEFREMMQFVDRYEITPTIDQVFGLSDALDAFDRFKAPDHFGKIIINFS